MRHRPALTVLTLTSVTAVTAATLSAIALPARAVTAPAVRVAPRALPAAAPGGTGVTRSAADVPGLPRAADGEVPALRTALSRTYATTSGSAPGFTTRVFAQPVNYRDTSGAWQKIDTTLSPLTGGGWSAGATPVVATLPAQLSAPVRVATSTGTVGFTLAGATGTGTASGATTTYANVLPGVDATETVTGTGVKEDLLLHSAAAAAGGFAETAALPTGMSMTAGNGGALLTVGGKPVAQVLAPSVHDANGVASTTAASLTVVGNTIRLAVDPAWLSAPGRAFPVTLDPTVVTSANNSNITSNQIEGGAAAATNYANATTTYVGTDPGQGNAPVRTLLNFGDLGAFIPRDAEIASATVGVNVSSLSGTPTIAVYPLAQGADYTPGSVTWNSKKSGTAWAAAGGDYLTAEQDSPQQITGTDNPHGTHNFYVSAAVLQSWLATGDQPGFLVKAGNEGTGGGGLVGLTPTSGVAPPYMNVTWDVRTGLRGDQKYFTHSVDDHEKLSVDYASGNVVDVSSEGGPGVFRTWNSSQAGYAWQNGRGWFNTPSDTGTYAYGPAGSTMAVNDGSRAVSSGTDGSDAFRWYPPSDLHGSTAITDPAGADTTTATTGGYAYTVTHNHSGVAESYANGNLVRIKDINGNTETISRDQSNFGGNGSQYAGTITDAAGRAWKLAYQPGGYITGLQPPAGSPAGITATAYSYQGGTYYNASDPASGELLTAKDAGGGATKYGYDSSQRITSITSPAGRVTTLAYNAGGQLASITYVTNTATGAGSTYTFAYTPKPVTGDGANGTTNLGTTVVTDPDGDKTTYGWNSTDEVVQVTDAAGNMRATGYDGAGSVTTAVDAMGVGGAGGNMSVYAFDSKENPLSATIPTGASSSLTYGSSGSCTPGNGNPHPYQPDCSTDPEGDRSTTTYDGPGNATSVKDSTPSGAAATASATYNPPAGQTATCGGLPGQTCTTTNSLGGTTNIAYDGQGNALTVTPPAPLGASSASYDSLGRTLTSTDGKGQKTSSSYDGLGRVTQVLTNGATTCTYSAGTCLTSTFDADGNQTQRQDATGTTTYTYDTLGRQTVTQLPGGSRLTLGYDGAGNVTNYTDGGGTITYNYNNLNELVGLAEPGGSCAVSGSNPTTYYTVGNPPPDSALCTTFAYNPNGLRTTTRYPGGTLMTVTLDNSGRVAEIKSLHSGSTLTDEKYAYTLSGADTEVTQTKTDLSGAVTTYSYDSQTRLTKASQTVVSPQTWTYGYDADGNRLNETGPTTGSHTFGYNTADQLTSQDGSTNGWSYDANGNETSGQGTATRTSETYSPTDQLLSLVDANTPSSFTYSGLANTERVTTTTTGTSTGYQNGEEGLANQTTGNATTSWTRDPGGTLISQRAGNTHYYYLYDGQGSVLGLVDTTGTIQAAYTYDPYGVTTTSGSTLAVANPWRYTSGYQDTTGLYHLNARYYNPTLGRFTQPDPSGQEANSYTYANEDPLDSADPSGLLHCHFCHEIVNVVAVLPYAQYYGSYEFDKYTHLKYLLAPFEAIGLAEDAALDEGKQLAGVNEHVCDEGIVGSVLPRGWGGPQTYLPGIHSGCHKVDFE